MNDTAEKRDERVQHLKQIIRHLHAGQPAEQVKGRLTPIVRQTDASEIVAMEQQLMAEGMPVEEVTCMCDLHSQVTRELLVPIPTPALPPGHPADTFRRENEALREVLAKMGRNLAALAAAGSGSEGLLLELRQQFNDLMDIDKHYQRKEHVLFSYLERHGIHGPSKVMWAKDDEVRGLLKELARALRQTDASAVAGAAAAVLGAVEEMMFKEDNILLPMCLERFTEADWAEIWAASSRYGWCLVEPREGYKPRVEGVAGMGSSNGVALPSGYLTLDQLVGIFSSLPVDLTFVDADDRVRFFSEGPDRIFSRSRAIIGRKVQNCHPPKSVDTVDRILSDFREGRQDVAEFWITLQGRFVHIRYFAVRSPQREYLGTLEVTQDLARLRKLEGEKRLLQYDEVKA